jgi:predicted dinucleotide-binding enzyme
MTIAIIGAGNVGRTLGAAWQQAGHEVRYGVRIPSAEDELSSHDAAATAEVVVLATPWEAMKDAIRGCGDLNGKILVDCTNPLLPKLAGLAVGTTTSGAEMAASLAPGAKVVKAFNTVGFNVMANPAFGDRRATMFYCGDDSAAKRSVHQLAADCGFEPVDAGPLTQARLLEPFALLWISLAYGGLGREIGFSLMRR